MTLLSSSAAGPASLSLSASDEAVMPGETIEVQVRLNTGNQAVNALEADIVYDQSSFEFVSLSDNNPPWDVNLNDPQAGRISLVKGTTSGSINDVNSLVSNLTFRSLDVASSSTIHIENPVVVRSSDSADVAGTTTGVTITVDNVSPSITIETPAEGAEINGTTELQFTVSDNFTVDRVDIVVDGSTVRTMTSAPYEFSFDTTALSDGAHSLSAVAYDAAGNSAQTPSRSFTTDNTVPTVSLNSLNNNSLVAGTVLLSAQATDLNGVAKVAFLINGAVVGEDSSSPYVFDWDTTNTTEGSHTVKVQAIDQVGNIAESSVTVIVDNTAPTASISSPSNGSTVSGTVRVSVNADDSHGVERVELLVNGTILATDTSAPYQFDWDSTAASGPANLVVRAFDNAGNATDSSLITVTIDNLRGDIDGNGTVNIFDLSRLLSKWGQTTDLGRNDINNDGVVNIFDLSMLLAQWGMTS